MRRLIAPVALIAALVLAGCSSPAAPDAAPTATSTASSKPVESPSPSAVDAIDMRALEQGFVDVLRQETGPDLISYTDEGLIKVGKSVCESLESNIGPASIETALTDSGFTKDAAVNVITGAGVLLCSDQGSKVLGGW